MMDVCRWIRHSEILSYLICHTFRVCFMHYCKSLCGDNEFTISYQIRRRDCEGKGEEVRGEMGRGAAGWGADMARLSWGPDFIYEAHTGDGSQAGRPTCCSCPGNIERWSEGIYRHQQNPLCSEHVSLSLSLALFFPSTPSLISSPPSFTTSLFILHFLVSFTPSLEQNLTTGTLLMSWLP